MKLASGEPVILGIKSNGDRIKISWDGRDGHWLAKEEEVMSAVHAVRYALERMVREYTSIGVSTLDLVRQVAKQGLTLRRRLFPPGPGDVAFAEIKNRGKVLFHIRDKSLYIPWGLIYGMESYQEEADAIDKSDLYELKDRFWCTRYQACAIYEGAEGNFGESLHGTAILPGSDLEVHSAFNKEAISYVNVVPRPPFVSARTFARNIANAPHAVAYFFGHATGETLRLHGDEAQQYDEPLSAGDLDDELRDTTPVGNRGFFFLNGCNTGVSDVSHSWLRVSRTAGFMGFVGTEAIVPTKFAWHFGNCFLDLVVAKGRTPLDAMQELREDYWPLSMVYGLYCRAEAQIEPPKNLEWVKSLSRSERQAVRDGLKGLDPKGLKYAFLPFEGTGV